MADTRFHRASVRAHMTVRFAALVLGVIVGLAGAAPPANGGLPHASWSHSVHGSVGASYRGAWSHVRPAHHTHRATYRGSHHRASSRHGHAVWVPARYSRSTYSRRYSSRTFYRSRVPSRFTLVELPPSSPVTVRVGTGSGLGSSGGAGRAAGSGFRAWQAAVRSQPEHSVVPLDIGGH